MIRAIIPHPGINIIMLRINRLKDRNRKRLWVVEARFHDGTWDVCDFLHGYSYVDTNYFKAHLLKRKIATYLNPKNSNGLYNWKKADFRVREYRILKRDKPLLYEGKYFHHRRLIRIENSM